MHKKVLVTLVVLLAVGFSLILAGVTNAFSTGIVGFSGKTGSICSVCHSGGQVPVVALSGPAAVTPGQVVNYTLTITSSNPISQTAAGLNVATSDGILQSLGPDTQTLNNEITHTGPKPNDANGVASFTFAWTAPDTLGLVMMYAAGNSVNQNGANTGDAPNSTTKQIWVAAPTDVTFTELTGVPGRSPWLLLGTAAGAGLFAFFLLRRRARPGGFTR